MPEYRQSILFRLECDPPAYLWSGAGPLAVGGDTYLGAGELLDGFPEIQQLINGTAQNIEVSVSGVNAETVRLAHEDRDSVDGARVRIGTLDFAPGWSTDGVVSWEWDGVAGVVTLDRSNDNVRTISLSVVAEDAARSRLQLSLFTDADQRRRSPTDSFFSHVAGITTGTTRRFGGRGKK